MILLAPPSHPVTFLELPATLPPVVVCTPECRWQLATDYDHCTITHSPV